MGKNCPGSDQVMDGLFRALTHLFDGRHDSLKSVEAIYYCCGPGSTLGLHRRGFCEDHSLGSKWQDQTLPIQCIGSCHPNERIILPLPSGTLSYGEKVCTLRKTRAIGEKKIIAEDRALTEYPDSLHLLGPRKLSIELPADKIVSYDLEKIRGIEGLSVVSEATNNLVPFSRNQPLLKSGKAGFLRKSNFIKE